MSDFDRFATFTALIQQIERSIFRIKTKKMAEYDLKAIHATCLYFISKHPEGISASEIVKKSGEDKASISRALSLLSDRGFIKSSQPTRSKTYKDHLTLTTEGEEIATYVTKEVDLALDTAAHNISDTERTLLYQSLTTIQENISNYTI